MAGLPVDLYRRGNATSPRLAQPRIPRDIGIVIKDGEEWVMAGSGGISTFTQPGAGRNWWKIAKGTEVPEMIAVRNDHGNHYLWEPAVHMPLSDYVECLRRIETKFERII